MCHRFNIQLRAWFTCSRSYKGASYCNLI